MDPQNFNPIPIPELIKLRKANIIKYTIEPLMKRYHWYDKTIAQREGQYGLIYDEIVHQVPINVLSPREVGELATAVLGMSPPVPDRVEGPRPCLCD